MKILTNKRLRMRCIIGLAALFLGLAISLAWPARSDAQTLSTCSWPLEVTGSGITNVAFPDTDATYWAMPFDTTKWKAITVAGQYPKSRFFSFTTYLGKGAVVDSIVDANLAPDSGSTNPFTPGPTSEPQNYTLTLSGDATASGNHLKWGNTPLGFVIYRIYVSDKGLSRMAGAPLPAVTFVDPAGNTHPARPCQFTNSAESVSDLIAQLAANESDAAASVSTDTQNSASNAANSSCQTGQPEQDVVTFAPNSSPGHFFPNPATTYVAAIGLCFQPNRIVVVRGKAAVFPDTYNGNSIFQPAIPGDIQMRYWSMCNNVKKVRATVVACQPDHTTMLDDQGFFTYVVSPDESGVTPAAPPSWVPANATWLPWGDQTIPNELLFREMLPVTNFTLTGDYYPKGVFCDKQLFVTQGWQACFAAAGETAP